MTDLPKLTEADIHNWTDPRSFQRGERYYRLGHIIGPHRQGHTLKARCAGSRPQPYHVEISLSINGILLGECSCPVGSGGHCKHAVALLLTWLHEPESFATVEDLETALGRRGKAELIVLIRRMLDRYPDLEALLELPIVGETAEAPPVDRETIRRQAQSAFDGIGYDEWIDPYAIAQQLLMLVDIGDDYAEIERWRDAGVVFQTVMEETLDFYGVMRDESGYLNAVVDRCVDGLETCLMAAEDPSRRSTLLEALFDVYSRDVDLGGIDVGYRAPGIILEQATPEEKRQVGEWVRDALSESESWGRQAYGHFLLRLEDEWLDDDDYLRICRETGRGGDLVERLLVLGRVDEAIGAAHEASDYVLLQLADVFVAHHRGEVAERLIRERMATSQNASLISWLKDRALKRGDTEEALALAERLLWDRPRLQRYQSLRAVARRMARWDDVREAVLTHLADGGHHTLLTKIHLDEGDVDRALEALERRGVERRRGARGNSLTLQVARAAEDQRPRQAIRLYVKTAQGLIAARGRGNYAVAATHLTRVRHLFRRLGEESAWETFIAELRENNPRLRALKDELNKAGL